jgi:hypothetical protein
VSYSNIVIAITLAVVSAIFDIHRWRSAEEKEKACYVLVEELKTARDDLQIFKIVAAMYKLAENEEGRASLVAAGACGVLVGELKIADEELEKSQIADNGTMKGIIAHAMNNLVMKMQGRASLVAAGACGAEKKQEKEKKKEEGKYGWCTERPLVTCSVVEQKDWDSQAVPGHTVKNLFFNTISGHTVKYFFFNTIKISIVYVVPIAIFPFATMDLPFNAFDLSHYLHLFDQFLWVCISSHLTECFTRSASRNADFFQHIYASIFVWLGYSFCFTLCLKSMDHTYPSSSISIFFIRAWLLQAICSFKVVKEEPENALAEVPLEFNWRLLLPIGLQIFSCCFIALKKQPLDSFDTTIYANVESLVINLLVVSSFYRFCSICGFPPPITAFLVVLGFLSFDSDQSKVRSPTPLRAADAPPKLTRWLRLIDFCCSFATIFGSGCWII